jgi:transglutaminase 1
MFACDTAAGYLLHRPSEDSVYMEREEHDGKKANNLQDEYVLADVGKIWMGAYGSARGREWVYGQYDDATLPVCMYLLEGCGIPHFERANPVVVSRALTKMVSWYYLLSAKLLRWRPVSCSR